MGSRGKSFFEVDVGDVKYDRRRLLKLRVGISFLERYIGVCLGLTVRIREK